MSHMADMCGAIRVLFPSYYMQSVFGCYWFSPPVHAVLLHASTYHKAVVFYSNVSLICITWERRKLAV